MSYPSVIYQKAESQRGEGSARDPPFFHFSKCRFFAELLRQAPGKGICRIKARWQQNRTGLSWQGQSNWNASWQQHWSQTADKVFEEEKREKQELANGGR